MKFKKSNCCLVASIGLLLSQLVTASKDSQIKELSIDEAVLMAQSNDPWLKMSQSEQSKLQSQAIVAGALNDPTVSVGLANIGADRFDFNQEPMTQLKVGLTQMFPRGNSREIKTDQFNLLASEQPILRENRVALLTKQVSLHWLDAFKAQKSIDLIEKDRPLFEQLIDLVEASYSSGFGQTRQQDLIRAQLELSRLDDRLSVLIQSNESNMEQLKGLISEYNYALDTAGIEYSLTKQLPELAKHNAWQFNPDQLNIVLSKHPIIKAMGVQIEAERKSVELAKQKYKPAWGLNTSYGYRDNAVSGISRADLFSIGVSFELPLFTKNRQDQEVKAAVFSVDGKESQKTLLLRELIAMFETAQSQLARLLERKELYEVTLIPQMHEQAEASLNAYTHNDGDFAEVIRARIAQMNAQIDALSITVDIAKANVQINYLLTGVKKTKTTKNVSEEKKS